MSRRHRKHHEDHDEHPSEAWLIALADMMTLLMVTFLMMFAIAIVDLQKFKTFAKAFSEATGQNLPTLVDEPSPDQVNAAAQQIAAAPPNPAPPSPEKPLLDREDLAELKQRVEAAIAKARIEDQVQVELDRRGLVLYVTSGVLFDSGEAALTTKGGQLLERLGPVLSPMSNELVVEGHTDSAPISSAQFPSNWELSTSRATAVLRSLVGGGIEATRMSASGYADTRPRAPNTSPEGMSKNRRVDIVVVAPPDPPAAAPAAAAAEEAAPAAEEEHDDGGH